jgi:hypothetical protein
MGAGGKMGVRLASNLAGSRFDVDHLEISQEGRARLKDAVGVGVVDQDAALRDADVIILAVPDRLIGPVSHDIIGKVKPGAALIVLDAAAPFAGEMPERHDVSYFCTHPCHPTLFPFTPDVDAQKDFFGGITAPQAIVCALIQGPDAAYTLCEEVARAIYGPVTRAHRCELEHIAILEPAMSETVGATLALALREATDEAIRRGVPEGAAMDFMLGHLKIELGIAFGAFPEGRFSDGALYAIEQARPLIFKDNWLENIFNPTAVKQSVVDICNPGKPAKQI